jgi:hypothetical protein
MTAVSQKVLLHLKMVCVAVGALEPATDKRRATPYERRSSKQQCLPRKKPGEASFTPHQAHQL